MKNLDYLDPIEVILKYKMFVPNFLYRIEGLRPIHREIYAILYNYRNVHIINQNEFFPFSNTKLSHIIGVQEKTVIQAVKELVAIRLLIKNTKQNNQNTYKLIEYWEILNEGILINQP